ncbi:relaxin-3 receptor 1-like [Nelusetta ayraudi]|uniref:relaxin-3 receptor 1-like n=1 Tax=Nelusetta ayraudi TaxID=303726 RepID=UPI003F7201EA
MSDADLDGLELGAGILGAGPLSSADGNASHNSTAEDWDPSNESFGLRMVISVVYFLVATAGVLGNLLVLFLLYSTRTITTGTINFLVFNLSLAQLLFSLALPFWAVENALDYSWPFSRATCKAVSLLTALNVFASCFFLTAMSLTRYCYVASALRSRAAARSRLCGSPLVAALVWVAALLAATPRAVYADLKPVGNDTACLVRFPLGTSWLGVYQLLRVLVAFLLPYAVISLSYLFMLRFLCQHKLKGSRSRRQASISRSVAVVVLSFCACWFPYNVLTFWSAMIHLDLVEMSGSYYAAQTYYFPLANCLAYSSSCFNPVIYCLVRREYRAALQSVLFKLGLAVVSKMPCGIGSGEASGQAAAQLSIPLNSVGVASSQCSSRRVAPLSTLPTEVSTL